MKTPVALNLRFKLLAGVAIVLFLMALVVTTTVITGRQSTETSNRLVNHLFPARTAAQDIVTGVRSADDDGAWYILTTDPQQAAGLKDLYRGDLLMVDEAVRRASELADTPEQHQALADFQEFFHGPGGYVASNEAAFAMKDAGRDAEARAKYVSVPYLPSLEAANMYARIVDESIARENDRLQDQERVARTLTIGLGLLALIAGGGVAWYLARSISIAVRQTAAAADSIARGDLSVRLDSSSGDEMGDLARSFTKMTEVLAEQKEADRVVLQSQKMESLGLLAGGIAHDFNNILVGIIGNAGLALAELPEESPIRPSILDIEMAGSRAAELSGELLAYSGRKAFTIAALDVNQVAGELVHLFKVALGKNVLLRLELAKRVPSVDSDAAQIRQILMNLVVNAKDAIGNAEGEITIRTGVADVEEAELAAAHVSDSAQPGSYVYVEVEDSGCGMDELTVARIFDPFFTTKPTGHGLGLSAVLGIVRAHKGALFVDSAPGKGTRFRLLLPPGIQQVAEPVPGTGNAEWQGGGTVLIVEDDQMARKVLARALKGFGFETIEAEDGRRGVQLFTAHADDLRCVVLDMTMPGMNGNEVLRAIRLISQDIPVLMVSGYSAEDTVPEPETPGRFAFVQKPYRLDELRSALELVLGTGIPSESLPVS